MNITKDTPIINPSDDLLNRSNYANKIAETIIESFDENSSLAIGINGAWGSGKSSFLNMIEYYLQSQNNDDTLICIHFNPWLYKTVEEIIPQFFEQFSASLKGKNTDAIKKGLKSLGNFFENTSVLLSIVKNIAQFKTFEKIISDNKNKRTGKVLQLIGEQIADYNWNNSISFSDNLKNLFTNIANKQEIDLHEQKKQISDNIKKSGKKFIIFIDDIDRVTDKECIAVFQLVKLIADFSNTIYLLAFDQNIISKVLNKCQKYDGKKYLEKIIQYTFNIPEIPSYILYAYIENELKSLFNKYNNTLDDNYLFLKIIWQEILSYDINHIRNANRYINTVRMMCYIRGNEIYFPDALVISALKLFHNTIYRKIGSSKELIFDIYNKIDNTENYYAEILNKLYSGTNTKKKTIISNCLLFLFPELNNPPHSISLITTIKKNSNLYTNQINNKNAFERYFDYPLTPNDVVQENVIKLLESCDSHKIAQKLRERHIFYIQQQESYGEDELMITIQNTLGNFITEKPIKNNIMIMESLIYAIIEASNDIWSINIQWRLSNQYEYSALLQNLLKYIGNTKAIEIISNIINDENLTLSQKVHLFVKYKKPTIDEIFDFLSIDQKRPIYENFVNAVIKSINDNRLLMEHNPDVVLYYATLFNEDKIKTALKKFIGEDDDKLLNYLDKIFLINPIETTGNGYTDYGISLLLFDNCLDRVYIKNRLINIVRKHKNLTENQKQYIATYLYNMKINQQLESHYLIITKEQLDEEIYKLFQK